MNFKFNRGTNISHWLSQRLKGDNYLKRFSEKDAAMLAKLGLDHLRLPFEEQILWDTSGNKINESWDLLHKGINWTLANGMNVILDLHSTRTHHFISKNENKLFTDKNAPYEFAEIWRKLSKEFASLPNDKVAYELLNEPLATDSEDWNRVLKFPYNAIRENESERVIAIGSNRWCKTSTYPEFKPPENDSNLILVFHYYNPMPVTHYRASWMNSFQAYKGTVTYPGIPYQENEIKKLDKEVQDFLNKENNYFDISIMESQLQPVLKKAKKMNLKLWCNEFGVINCTPEKIAGKWYKDLIYLFNKHNISWANWDFKGGFGIFDQNNKPTANAKYLFQK